MNYDMPFGNRTVAFAAPDVKADFIRKVYQLFLVSILVTVGVGWYCAQPAVLPGVRAAAPVIYIALFVSGIAMAFMRRTSGLNIGVYMLFSALWGAAVGPLLVMVDRFAPGIPLQAATMTVAAFTGLSVYALTSKKDFSYLGGFLCASLLALIIGGFVLMFFHSSMLSLLYSIGGIVIFCGYILYDTSQIIHRLGPDEAVGGAISLYLDFINLFMFILRLLMTLQGRDD
jgi:FtsH-binding integral membrane protein